MDTILIVEGVQEFDVRSRQALDVTVGLRLPVNPSTDTFAATALIVAKGTDSPILMVLPIQPTVDLAGRENNRLDFVNGRRWICRVRARRHELVFQSTLRQDVAGVFSCVPSAQSRLSFAGEHTSYF